ncbi:MAG: hypothetical protein M0P71_16170 [Melioribacteraceae bacterium]|jgi:hypothetical protein|nr:hypothetical protein [Melioribacteraceae bacterium]
MKVQKSVMLEYESILALEKLIKDIPELKNVSNVIQKLVDSFVADNQQKKPQIKKQNKRSK